MGREDYRRPHEGKPSIPATTEIAEKVATRIKEKLIRKTAERITHGIITVELAEDIAKKITTHIAAKIITIITT